MTNQEILKIERIDSLLQQRINERYISLGIGVFEPTPISHDKDTHNKIAETKKEETLMEIRQDSEDPLHQTIEDLIQQHKGE